tara:strand:+ start:15642 stop:16430 length:789 start_codon:yes stop_codon:yes gene_type:complete
MVIPNVEELARKHFMRIFKRSVLVLVLLLTFIVLIGERQKLVLLIDHPIDKMSVAGEFKYQSPEGLKRHISHFIGQGFLSADLEDMKRYIESLPWVYQATVSRVWPGEIKVRVEEQVAVSYWNSSGFINEGGELFVPNEVTHNLQLPMLRYVNSSNDVERLGMYQLFNYIQKELSVFELKATILEQEARGTWELTLSNGIGVVLGHVDQSADGRKALDDKLERVGKLLSSKSDLSPEKINKLDTRYPNGIAVQWISNIDPDE